MGDVLQRLVEFRDLVKSSAAKLVPVLQKTREVVEAAEQLAQDVADGKVFAPPPAATASLDATVADLEAVAAGEVSLPVGAAGPAEVIAAVQAVLEVVKLVRGLLRK